MVRREKWSNFKIEISPKSKKPHPQKLVHMYYTLTPTCITVKFSRKVEYAARVELHILSNIHNNYM